MRCFLPPNQSNHRTQSINKIKPKIVRQTFIRNMPTAIPFCSHTYRVSTEIGKNITSRTEKVWKGMSERERLGERVQEKEHQPETIVIYLDECNILFWLHTILLVKMLNKWLKMIIHVLNVHICVRACVWFVAMDLVWIFGFGFCYTYRRICLGYYLGLSIFSIKHPCYVQFLHLWVSIKRIIVGFWVYQRFHIVYILYRHWHFI